MAKMTISISREVEFDVDIFPNKTEDGFCLHIHACNEEGDCMNSEYDLFKMINDCIDDLNKNNFGVEYSELFKNKLLDSIKRIQ